MEDKVLNLRELVAIAPYLMLQDVKDSLAWELMKYEILHGKPWMPPKPWECN